jgi:outer membrane protein assembly factor BamB
MIVTTRPKPAASTVGLAWDGSRLWAGDHQSQSLYALNADGAVASTFSVPGRPLGLAFTDKRLAAVIAHPETDNRSIRSFDPDSGSWLEETIRCPDDTGSHLAWDGGHLWLSQRYNKTLLQLNPDGTVRHSIDLPFEVTGFSWIGATAWMNLRVETGFSDIAKRGPGASRPTLLERIPGGLASLAFDGSGFWTVDLRGENYYRVTEEM